MKRLVIGVLLCAGCSSPTAPSPSVATLPPVVVAPPVVPPPVVPPPARNPLLNDPRFSLSFYRQFALNGLESPTRLYPLARQTAAPKIYLRTIHDITGAAIDALSIEQTAAALINTVGSLTGTFGLAALERGTDARDGRPGWITVHWTNDPDRRYCGMGSLGGAWIELYVNTPNCRCVGGAAVRLTTVKHELGHVLGYFHTDSPNDLMYATNTGCDKSPSDREIFHARVAYSQPLGSLDP